MSFPCFQVCLLCFRCIPFCRITDWKVLARSVAWSTTWACSCAIRLHIFIYTVYRTFYNWTWAIGTQNRSWFPVAFRNCMAFDCTYMPDRAKIQNELLFGSFERRATWERTSCIDDYSIIWPPALRFPDALQTYRLNENCETPCVSTFVRE